MTSYYGDFYVVENAKIYTLPKNPIPIYVAAEGSKIARTAGKIGDGLIITTPAGTSLGDSAKKRARTCRFTVKPPFAMPQPKRKQKSWRTGFGL